MKSSAAVAHSPHSPFSIEDVELPDLQDTDVLVRIVAVGMALAGLARRGTLGLVAVPPSAERTLAVPWAPLLLQGQAVRGFMEGNSVRDVFIPRMIDLYAQGRFPSDKFVRFYPFDEINRAVEDQRNGLAIKPILQVAAA
jgi:aryl-alcohol dehydrogenase